MRVERWIVPSGPLRLAHALLYLRTSPSAVLEKVTEDACRRALRINERAVLLQVRQEGQGVRVTLWGDALDDATVAAAEAEVRRIFLLDEDPGAFYREVPLRDRVLGRVMEDYLWARPVLIADPLEALMWAIIGQQVNVAFARKLKARLVELCGSVLEVDGERYWVFPPAWRIADLPEDLLRGNQFSRQKSRYILGLARAVASGELDLRALGVLPVEDAIAELVRFLGVGRWTAEYVLMRGLGRPDVIPAADLGLRAVMGRHYLGGRVATEAEVREISAAWSPWRAWGAWLWWLHLQVTRGV